MLSQGVQAPDFKLRDMNGESRSLKEMLSGGPVALAFFKVSCPVCQFTFPYLERLHAGGSGVRIVGISQDSAQETRSYNKEFGVTFPTLLDGAGFPVSNAFGIHSVPTLFLIEPDGKIALSESGFSRPDLEALGQRMGVAPFRAGERVPDYKPG
jgi:peroxiredoxin